MWARYLVLAGAGFLAGMVNSVAGGGTLISFPALIWSGLDPIVANATSAVALWPGSLGGALGYKSQVSDAGQLLRWMIPSSLVGGGLGAFLLLRTDPKTFAMLVPWLLLSATLLLALQETVTRRLSLQPSNRRGLALAAFLQLFVGIYGGYFGAGIGILMLAVLGLLGERDIHRMNGLKNVFACCINGVAAIYFILKPGAVTWDDVLVVALSALAGGLGGAGLALKLGRQFVRRFVVALGLILSAVSFWRG
jgi:uncharacterized membrane protein YfcA